LLLFLFKIKFSAISYGVNFNEGELQ